MKKQIIIIVIVLLLGILTVGFGCTNVTPNPIKMPLSTSKATKSPIPTAEPIPTTEPIPTPEEPLPTPEGMVSLGEGFTLQAVPQEVRERMIGKSYPKDCPVSFDDLRYLQLLHTGFDNETHQGEMIVNSKIAKDALEIFKELYEAKYPIEKVRLIDEYNAVDEESMTDNNTSAFCYRTISGTNKLSYHARGLAVDINTLYNPYVSEIRIEPAAGKEHAYDRENENPYYIDTEDLCYTLFTERGFTWGGSWDTVKDYQHFEMRDE